MPAQDRVGEELERIAFAPAHSSSAVSLDSLGGTGSSKRKAMKKKLSKIAFPFSSGDANAVADQQDGYRSQTDEDDLSSGKFAMVSMTPKKSSSASQKSRSNSITSSSGNSRYKQLNSNTSTHSLLSPISSKNGPSGKRNVTHSPPSSTYHSNNLGYSSPHKLLDPRYLATSNDHAFLFSHKHQSSHPPPIIVNNPASSLSSPLPSPPSNSHKSSSNTHSASGSIDDHYFSKHSITSQLPQINHANGTAINIAAASENGDLLNNHNKQTVLLPPTVLAPIYKTSSSQSNSQHSYNSATSANLNPITHSHSNLATNESISNPVSNSNSSANSQHTRQKRRTGLLQSAYRSSHAHSKSNGGQTTTTHETDNGNGNILASRISSAVSVPGQTQGSAALASLSAPLSDVTVNSSSNLDPRLNFHSNNNPVSIKDSRYHIISPQIVNQFQGLKRSIQLGMKKRIEILDSENLNLLHELDTKIEEFEIMEIQLKAQLEELNKYIDILTQKKDNDIKNLRQDGLFEKLNDLSNRIDMVREKMDENKASMKKFETQLDSIEKLKHTYAARSENRKKIFTVSAVILIFSVLLQKWFH